MSGASGRAGPTRARRLARALLTLALAAVAIATAGGAGRLAGSGVLAEAVEEAVGGGGAVTADALPDGFEEEAMSVAGRSEVRSDARAGLVGFTERRDAEEAFRAAAEELAAKGWKRVESGMPSCGTFSKEGGRLRWLFVSCVQVGEGASVVVQCEPLADERS